MGSKDTLEQQIHEITGIPLAALRMTPLSDFSVDERMRWAEKRETKKKEDKAYCLIGIFGISMSLRYGEGDNALRRLKEKTNKLSGEKNNAVLDRETKLNSLGFSPSAASINVYWTVTRSPNTLFTGRDDILQHLDNIITDCLKESWVQKQCRIVITGMGGQGKSEICLQLAHRLRQM